MKPLSERMAAMDALLAPYATKNASRGRPIPEENDGIRTPFQRDRGRIIHSQAFRRMAGKTQVFVTGEGDHYRTRLTHTMEVAQITRNLARALELNEDLAECIALAHDLGHTPFGHNGQDALDAWMRSHGRADGFEHNIQSHRVVTLLEQRGTDNGLNLTHDVADNLLKHGPVPLCHEGQLANACDEIAYTAHDTDDGLRAGLFSYDDLRRIPFADHAATIAEQRGTRIRTVIIDLLARDLLASAEKTTANGNIVISISPDMRTQLAPLRAFLFEHMYEHPTVLERMEQGKRTITTLCDALHAAPTPAVIALQERTGSSLPEAIKDLVAGMTDTYATREAERCR